MTGLDGATALRCGSRFVVILPALETTAGQVLVAVTCPTSSDGADPLTAKLTPPVKARLDADSTSRWYLSAHPARFPVLEMAHLSGAPGPQIEQRPGWESLAVEFRCFIDVGVGAIGYRGAARSEGS